jgi:C4-dicarboxylate-binding protein DctP
MSMLQLSRRSMLAALAGGTVLAQRSFGAGKPDITLRFSHVVAEETPKGLAARHFKDLIEQRSGGRIAVQVFPNGRLYGDHDEIQALKLGAVDLVAPSLSKFGRIGLPEFELFDLPFVFDDLSAVRRIF